MHHTSNTLSYGSLWIFCSYTGSVYSALTSLRQELDGLQHTLGVDPGLIVFHLSVNDVDHASSSAPDSSSSSVKSVHIALLESYYTFVDILKDVVLLRVRERKDDSEWKWEAKNEKDPRILLLRDIIIV